MRYKTDNLASLVQGHTKLAVNSIICKTYTHIHTYIHFIYTRCRTFYSSSVLTREQLISLLKN